MIMEAAAPPGLKAGDRVTIEIPERSTLAAALLLLFAPLVLLFGGTLLGYKLIPGQGEVNVPALLVGAALMVAWYVGVHFVDKKRARSSPNPPRIVEIGPEAPPSRTGGTSAGEGEEDAKNPPDSWM
jgi:positive regulator of sigma E activity